MASTYSSDLKLELITTGKSLVLGVPLLILTYNN